MILFPTSYSVFKQLSYLPVVEKWFCVCTLVEGFGSYNLCLPAISSTSQLLLWTPAQLGLAKSSTQTRKEPTLLSWCSIWSLKSVVRLRLRFVAAMPFKFQQNRVPYMCQVMCLWFSPFSKSYTISDFDKSYSCPVQNRQFKCLNIRNLSFWQVIYFDDVEWTFMSDKKKIKANGWQVRKFVLILWHAVGH